MSRPFIANPHKVSYFSMMCGGNSGHGQGVMPPISGNAPASAAAAVSGGGNPFGNGSVGQFGSMGLAYNPAQPWAPQAPLSGGGGGWPTQGGDFGLNMPAMHPGFSNFGGMYGGANQLHFGAHLM